MSLERGRGEWEEKRRDRRGGRAHVHTLCVPGTCPMHDCLLLIALLVSEEVRLDTTDLAGGIFTISFPLHVPLMCPTIVYSCCMPHMSVVCLGRLPKLFDPVK